MTESVLIDIDFFRVLMEAFDGYFFLCFGVLMMW